MLQGPKVHGPRPHHDFDAEVLIRTYASKPVRLACPR